MRSKLRQPSNSIGLKRSQRKADSRKVIMNGQNMNRQTISKAGAFEVEATRVGAHSVLAQVMRLMRDAQA